MHKIIVKTSEACVSVYICTYMYMCSGLYELLGSVSLLEGFAVGHRKAQETGKTYVKLGNHKLTEKSGITLSSMTFYVVSLKLVKSFISLRVLVFFTLQLSGLASSPQLPSNCLSLVYSFTIQLASYS